MLASYGEVEVPEGKIIVCQMAEPVWNGLDLLGMDPVGPLVVTLNGEAISEERAVELIHSAWFKQDPVRGEPG